MNSIKKISRKYIFPLTLTFGFEKCFSAFTRHRCLILNYHGVVRNYNPELSKNHIPLDQFKNHLEYFHRTFDVVSVSEAFHIYQNKIKLKKKTIAITFDDGYENNLTNAVPALNKYAFPATIFVTAGTLFQPTSALWYDQLDLLKSKINFQTLQDRLKNIYPEILKIQSYSALKNHFKGLNKSGKEVLLSGINSIDEFHQAIFSCNREYWKMMDEVLLKQLASEKRIEIGSHTVSHSNLDQLATDDLMSELKESINILGKSINRKVESIAFPDGAYNEKVKKACLEAGYSRLLAVNYHLVSDSNDPMILPRLSISNTTTFESVMISIHRAFSTHSF